MTVYVVGSASGGAGGAVAGVPIVRKFSFAYNTPGLLTGATVYTPTIGDILLDAWIEIDTAWDGTTPWGDVGEFIGGSGWFLGGAGYGLDFTQADTDIDSAEGLLVNYASSSNTANGNLPLATGNVNGVGVSGPLVSYLEYFRMAPAKFTAANPIKVVVSQDGTNIGADPGSTQGTAVLYLVTATPA